MTPEEYAEKNSIFSNPSIYQPIVVATIYKKLLISAKKMNITDINDIGAFNKAMYNDVLLNRTCLTSNGEYQNLPTHLSYLYLCDISELFKEIINIYENKYIINSYIISTIEAAIERKLIYKYCSDYYISFLFDGLTPIILASNTITIGNKHYVFNSEQLVRTLKLNEIKEFI